MKNIFPKNIIRTSTGELNLFSFFVFFTIVPTILAFIYYIFIASDMYISKTQFSIYNNEPKTQSIELGALSQLTSNSVKSESLEQLLIVSEYIKSYDMLKLLDKEMDLKSIYSSKKIDFLSRLPKNPTHEEFIEYFDDIARVKVNREANTISLEIKSPEPEKSQEIAKRINILAEDFINKMLSRIKSDTLYEAEYFVAKSEKKIKDIQNKISNFRTNNTTLDPNEELQAKLEFIRALEMKKAEYLIEKNDKKSFLGSKSISMKSIDTRINNVINLIEKTRKEILNFSKEGTDILREYSMLLLDEEFAKEEYKLALVNLEDTIKNQSRINKYIVEILKPTKPDVATEPNRMLSILSVFAQSFIFFGILSLMIAGIRDHIIV